MSGYCSILQVFKIAYCDFFCISNQDVCKEIFYHYFPDFRRKVKIHILLHLVDCFVDFGPTSGYNTERYELLYIAPCIIILILRFEAFNSLLRARNIFANRLAPSRDIARGFNVIGHLRSLCAGGVLGRGLDRKYIATEIYPITLLDIYNSVGRDLLKLYSTPAVQVFLNGIPAREMSDKVLYHHGTLRKVCM